MIKTIQMPSGEKAPAVIVIVALFLLLTAACTGLRSEHLSMAALYPVLFFARLPTRKLAVALLLFAVFRVSYDWMRTCPNYEVNPIGVIGLYSLEKSLLGVANNGVLVIPCEYLIVHRWAIVDVFVGIFYLCWVPAPILFRLCLYLKKERKTYLRFALVFLFVNSIGFAGYYIHPAAPPWYAINYGFEPILNTPGNVVGLGRFDEIFGVTIFGSIYGRNASVFVTVSSLHAAYMVVTLVYAIIGKCRWYVVALLPVIMAGTWGAVIYSCHHYIIDVFLGISCALLSWLLFEYGLMKIRGFRNSFDRRYQYVR